MKTLRLYCIAFLILVGLNAHSAIVVINQDYNYFVPSNVSVHVGDIVRWVRTEGTHTTTSKTIPIGAQAWDAPLTASNTSFEYTVTVAGVYSYVCSIHESMGMIGSFTATVSTSIAELDMDEIISIYPNPAFSHINLKTSLDGDILLSDVLGKSIGIYPLRQLDLLGGSYKLDLMDLAEGIYIISFLPSNSKKRTSLKFIKK